MKGNIKLSKDEELEVVEKGKFKVKNHPDQGGQLGEGAKLINQLFSAPGDSR